MNKWVILKKHWQAAEDMPGPMLMLCGPRWGIDCRQCTNSTMGGALDEIGAYAFTGRGDNGSARTECGHIRDHASKGAAPESQRRREEEPGTGLGRRFAATWLPDVSRNGSGGSARKVTRTGLRSARKTSGSGRLQVTGSRAARLLVSRQVAAGSSCLLEDIRTRLFARRGIL
jgi:hypothetical protein